jgi:hypothetical protein
MKTIGVWGIEYPTNLNGRHSDTLAFIRDNHRSGYVSLYGGGKIGIESGVRCGNKQVIKYLEKLSLNLNK